MSDTDLLKKQTMSGLFWKMAERFAAQLVSFVVSLVLARILTPNEYGIVAIVTVFISFADILVSNGLGATLVQKKDADDLDFNTIFLAGIILSFLLYAIIFLGAPMVANFYYNELISPVLRVMGLRVPIAAVNSVQQAYVSRKMDFRKFFVSTFFGTVISGVVGIIMALNGCGVWALVGQYLTNTVIDTTVLFFTVGWRPKMMFSFERFSQLFSFGGKIMLTGFIGMFFSQLKSLIIGAKYTAEDLAYYNKGENFPSLICNNIETSVTAVLFPAFSRYQDDKYLLRNAMSRFIKTGSYVIMPMVVGLAACSKPLVQVLLTDKWLQCVPYIRVVCIQMFFSILNTANLQVIKAQGHANTLVKLEYIKKPILLAILIVTMQFSPMLIAIGVAAYEVIAACINSVPTKRMINYSILFQLRDLLPNIVLSLLMGILVISISLIKLAPFVTLIIQIVVGIIAYLGFSLVTKNKNFYYILNLLKFRKG